MPIGVIGAASPASTTTSMARADTPFTAGLRYFGSHGIRSSNHCAASAIAWHCRGLVLVDVGDRGFPRPFAAAGVHVDLDEAVDGVDRRLAIGDPGDVVGAAILDLARPVEAHQGLQRGSHRGRGVRDRVLEVADDAADGRVVAAADPVDLFDQAGRRVFTSRAFSS